MKVNASDNNNKVLWWLLSVSDDSSWYIYDCGDDDDSNDDASTELDITCAGYVQMCVVDWITKEYLKSNQTLLYLTLLIDV